TTITKSLGALYADEAMSSTMVSKLNDGLTVGGHGEDVRFFFTLHMQAEIGHSNSVFNAFHPYARDEEAREVFESGAFAFLSLLEKYWDAVQKLLQIDI